MHGPGKRALRPSATRRSAVKRNAASRQAGAQPPVFIPIQFTVPSNFTSYGPGPCSQASMSLSNHRRFGESILTHFLPS